MGLFGAKEVRPCMIWNFILALTVALASEAGDHVPKSRGILNRRRVPLSCAFCPLGCDPLN